MQNSWIVLLPPLLVLLLAATTRRVFIALFTGIFSALLIAYDGDIVQASLAFFPRMWKTIGLGSITSLQTFWSATYLFICLFLLLIGILITLLRASGGAYAYATFVSKRVRSSKNAEVSSLILSLFFFIDDYFSCLTVGSVMQAVTDKFSIPRVKLGLLINSMAAPLVVLLPVSSWVAEIIAQLKQSGVGLIDGPTTSIIGDPFAIYIKMISFLFYSFIVIAAVWYMVLRRISYGIIHKHEQIATRTGNLYAGKISMDKKFTSASQEIIATSSMLDFIVPIGLLFISVLGAILYFGSYHLFGGSRGLVSALQSADVAPALFMGTLITLVVTIIFLLGRNRIAFKDLKGLFSEGFGVMGTSVCILILIWTLGSLIRYDLLLGQFLASQLIGYISIWLLPVMFFFVAVLIASTMGSAWGTLGILIPIGIPMLVSMLGYESAVDVSQIQILYPLLGAIISGSVVGNHMSPISDTMLMSSTSSGAYHIDLVKAQLSLTVPCVIATACSFGVAGWLISTTSLALVAGISLFVGLSAMVVLLHLLQRFAK